MKRAECYLTPVFDSKKLSLGVKVEFVRRNRKGREMERFIGYIIKNFGDKLYIQVPNRNWPIEVVAKSVYYGKDHLKILEGI